MNTCISGKLMYSSIVAVQKTQLDRAHCPSGTLEHRVLYLTPWSTVISDNTSWRYFTTTGNAAGLMGLSFAACQMQH